MCECWSVSIILSTPWIFSSLWGEYFQRGWWEFLTARLLPPAWLNRAYQSVTTFDSLDGSWRAGGWGVGVRRVSGGAEVISRGWRLLLILILTLNLPLFEKRTWTFWSVFSWFVTFSASSEKQLCDSLFLFWLDVMWRCWLLNNNGFASLVRRICQAQFPTLLSSPAIKTSTVRPASSPLILLLVVLLFSGSVRPPPVGSSSLI